MFGELVVVDDVAGEFAERVVEAYHGRPNDGFSLALSGGETARRCYERLAEDAGKQIDWWTVDVYWGDERCVPLDHEASNYRLGREALLERVGAVNANFPMRCEDGPDPYQLRLGELGRIDVVHLGLGADGHTASLFPGSAALDADPGRLVVMNDDPDGLQPPPAHDAHVRGHRPRPPRPRHGVGRVQARGPRPGRRGGPGLPRRRHPRRPRGLDRRSRGRRRPRVAAHRESVAVRNSVVTVRPPWGARPHRATTSGDCSIAASLAFVGDRWTLLILRDAFRGVRRFGDFCADLGIARNILTDRLDKLVDAGIFVRDALPGAPGAPRVPAHGKGRDLSPALVALMRWGDRWASTASRPPSSSTTPAAPSSSSSCGAPTATSRSPRPTSGAGTDAAPEPIASGRAIRDAHHGTRITYSPKVFIPLTMLCRDRCGYCTFAKAPARIHSPVPHSPTRCSPSPRPAPGRAATRPSSPSARRPRSATRSPAQWLAEHGYASTVDYLAAMAPPRPRRDRPAPPRQRRRPRRHDDLAPLRAVAPSQGMMIESLRADLAAHRGAPDKTPERRLATLEAAGELQIPFTTGILVGIGEDRADRIDALEAIADSHRRHGHVQEVIVQNFLPKPGHGDARRRRRARTTTSSTPSPWPG